jgi:hypothetical protein
MKPCPCCENVLVQEFHRGQLSWFCRHCWQDMPDFDTLRQPSRLISLQAARSQRQYRAASILHSRSENARQAG